MAHLIEPDVGMTKRFLDLIDPDCGGVFTFQTFSDRKAEGEKHKGDPNARVFHGTLDEHLDRLVAMQRKGAGVFVMINKGDGVVHEPNKTCRAKASVVEVRSLWVDLDGAPIEPVLMAYRPDIVVESSPCKWHAYWPTRDCAIADFCSLQSQIAKKYNGDPTMADLARVMRIPGFWHQKGEPYQTRLIYPD